MNTPELMLANRLEMADNLPMSRAKSTDRESFSFASPNDSLAELIARGKAGDIAALETIYGRYKTALFHLACRYTCDRATAEDLLQEIFVKVFTHLMDVTRIETFTAWVYRIALNTCFSYLRGKRVEIEKSVPLADVEHTLSVDSGDTSNGDLRRPLDEAIGRLPRKLKEIFILHDVQGFKHEEIARILGLAVGTSKSQLFKARLRLRQDLRAKGMC